MEKIKKYNSDSFAALIARSLFYEVCTTPKPGLVDCNNCGSHTDMDIFTFTDSICALIPYFKKCFETGETTSGLLPEETFEAARRLGIAAEKTMLCATNGVNTHKGTIFIMGTVAAAAGRINGKKVLSAENISTECMALTKGVTERDFAHLTEQNASTTGEKLYLKYGIKGVRGQVEAGFPAVLSGGLPVLSAGVERGLTVAEAGYVALLKIIAVEKDTCIIHRSSYETQVEIQNKISALLKKEPFPAKEEIEALDREFIKLNIAPGGSADLLALCYLFYFLENDLL